MPNAGHVKAYCSISTIPRSPRTGDESNVSETLCEGNCPSRVFFFIATKKNKLVEGVRNCRKSYHLCFDLRSFLVV